MATPAAATPGQAPPRRRPPNPAPACRCRATCRLVSRAWAATPQPAASMTQPGGGAEKLALLLHAPAFRGVRRLDLGAEPGVLAFLAHAGGLPSLAELHLSDVAPEQWPGLGATIVRAAPNLQHLAIDGGGADGDRKGGLDALLGGLPRLHTLLTSRYIGSTMRPTAAAPALRVLRIGSLPAGVDWGATFPVLEELEWLQDDQHRLFRVLNPKKTGMGAGMRKLDVWNYTSVAWLAAPLPQLRWLACQSEFVAALPRLPRLEALKLYDACFHIESAGEDSLDYWHEHALALANTYPHLSSLVFSDSAHSDEWRGQHALLAMNALAAMQRALGPRIAVGIE